MDTPVTLNNVWNLKVFYLLLIWLICKLKMQLSGVGTLCSNAHYRTSLFEIFLFPIEECFMEIFYFCTTKFLGNNIFWKTIFLELKIFQFLVFVRSQLIKTLYLKFALRKNVWSTVSEYVLKFAIRHWLHWKWSNSRCITLSLTWL